MRLLDTACDTSYASNMEVQVTPEMEARLDQLAKETGRAQSEYVQDALYAYFGEIIPLREMLDRRYDEIMSGKVTPIAAKDVFRRLREKSIAARSAR